MLCTTSASALDHDKGKALALKKMLTLFSTSESMQSIDGFTQKESNDRSRKDGAVV